MSAIKIWKTLSYYHFGVVLELTEDYSADFWQSKLNNNRIGEQEKKWTDHKSKKGQPATILNRTRTAKNLHQQNLLAKSKKKQYFIQFISPIVISPYYIINLFAY